MKILLTGSNGYVGKSLYTAFSHAHETTRLTHGDLDLCDSKAVDEWFSDKSFDVVIHSAAVGGSRLAPDTSSIADQNLGMYYNLRRNKNKFGKLISFGSGAEIFMPNTFYGLSKKSIASSIENTENFFNIRIFAVFNHNELPTRFIKSNMMRLKSNQDIEIHSNKVMDFFYMDDLISLVNYYMEQKNPPKEINCSYESKTTLKEIADKINSLGSNKVEIKIKDHEKLDFYCGNHTVLPITYVGLSEGMKTMFGMLQ